MSTDRDAAEVSTFTLTGAERDGLRALAAELEVTEPRLVDAAEWVAAARVLSCRVPARLRERLREFGRDPGDGGAVLLRNLPVDVPRLPPMPTVAGSVERDATSVAAVQVLLMLQLGEPVAFRNEKAGALVQNVVPVPGQEKLQSNAGSTGLELHVENAFHPYRPDLVALLCLRNDHEDRAGLHVGSIRHAAPLLSDDVKKVLGEERYMTEPPASFGDLGGGAAAHAVLTGAFDDPDVRVDFTTTRPLDAGAGRALDRLREAFERVHRTVVLRPGDLALLDNRFAIHGRTAFTPRYDGNDRWLYRTFVHVDLRRSRALRAGNGHVLA